MAYDLKTLLSKVKDFSTSKEVMYTGTWYDLGSGLDRDVVTTRY